MDGQKYHRKPHEDPQEHGQHLPDVAGKEVADKFPDVLINDPAFLDGGNQRGKVVVQKDHVGGFPGHIRAGNAHGNADVGFLDGGGVVDPVAGHGGDVAKAFVSSYDLQLVTGADPGENSGFFDDLQKGVVGHGGKFFSGEDPIAGAEDPQLFCGGAGGGFMVAGDHDGTDPRLPAEGDGFFCFLSGRIHQTRQPHENQPGG